MLRTTRVNTRGAELPLGFDLVVVVCPAHLGRTFEEELARRAPALTGRTIVTPWADAPPSGVVADGGGGLLAGLYAAADALSAREGRGALSAEVFAHSHRSVLVVDASASCCAHPALPAALLPWGPDGRDGLDHAFAAAARLWPRPTPGAALISADEVLTFDDAPGLAGAPRWADGAGLEGEGSAPPGLVLLALAAAGTSADRAATRGVSMAPVARVVLSLPAGPPASVPGGGGGVGDALARMAAYGQLAPVARLLPPGGPPDARAAGWSDEAARTCTLPLASAAHASPAMCGLLVSLLDAPLLHGACARGWDSEAQGGSAGGGGEGRGGGALRLGLLAGVVAAACRAVAASHGGPGGHRDAAQQQQQQQQQQALLALKGPAALAEEAARAALALAFAGSDGESSSGGGGFAGPPAVAAAVCAGSVVRLAPLSAAQLAAAVCALGGEGQGSGRAAVALCSELRTGGGVEGGAAAAAGGAGAGAAILFSSLGTPGWAVGSGGLVCGVRWGEQSAAIGRDGRSGSSGSSGAADGHDDHAPAARARARVPEGFALWEVALSPAALTEMHHIQPPLQLPPAQASGVGGAVGGGGGAQVRLLCAASDRLDAPFRPIGTAASPRHAAGSIGPPLAAAAAATALAAAADIGDAFWSAAAAGAGVEEGGTFCGQGWAAWLSAKGLEPDDLWDGSEAARSLRTARLFPLAFADAAAADAAASGDGGCCLGREMAARTVADTLRAQGEAAIAASFLRALAPPPSAGQDTAAASVPAGASAPPDDAAAAARAAAAAAAADFASWAMTASPPPTAAQRAAWRACARVSFAQAARAVDVAAEGRWRAALHARAALAALAAGTAAGSRAPLGAAVGACARAGDGCRAAAAALLDARAERSSVVGLARLLAASAELVAASAGGGAAARSGAARGSEWAAAASQLATGAEAVFRAGSGEEAGLGAGAGAASAAAAGAQQQLLHSALAALRALRDRALALGSRPELVRAARHLEAAAAAVAEGAVMAAAVSPQRAPAAPAGWAVVVRAPARIDLAGGWSDTPPLCWEASLGGAVLNAAVAVGGALPLRARARRIAEAAIVLVEGSSSAAGDPRAHAGGGGSVAVLTELSELRACSDPAAPFALLRAAVLSCGVLRLDAAAPPLRAQLGALGGGVELSCRSDLPHGSGLGTSSILGAAAIAAVAGAFGLSLDGRSLVHAVLQLEQRLSSRGGWQDQVGGVFPGVKLATCTPKAPPDVSVRLLELTPHARAALDAHLCLAFTGRTRLARGLLEGVLRAWHGGSAEVADALAQLVGGAHAMAAALQAADMAAAGRCLSHYWQLKKLLCADAEPPSVARMLARARPLVHGAALAGAGGGGFLLMLTREPNASAALTQALAPEGAAVYGVSVVYGHGLVLTHEPEHNSAL